MADLEWLLAEIENSPPGPAVGAFFDFDGTLIAGYSAVEFFRERLKQGQLPLRELIETVQESAPLGKRDVTNLINAGVKAQAGQNAADLDTWSRKVFAKRIAKMVYPEARVILRAHSDRGHTIVIASSATAPQIRPTAEDLGIKHVICTEVAVDRSGVITGKLASEIRWGPEKAKAVAEFAGEHKVELSKSFFYTNGAEDLPLLKQVGYPRPTNPVEDLAEIARHRGWPIVRLLKPAKQNPLNVLRSAAAIAAFGGGVFTGVALGALNWDRAFGVNVAGSIAPALGLATAGVRLNIVGEQNLWLARPAVFLFNHQSQIDLFVLSALLRRDFTGVAKKSLAHDPLFAPIGYVADVAYINRSDNAAARAALKPVVEALKKGRSIAIAPEGTRSPTERLLPFKKGAFHIAMQAKVPIVPMVMRNCGELMRPHSYIVTPGTIDVAILPPIDTSDWAVKDIDHHVDEVRQLYLDTLAHWPESANPKTD